MSDTGPIMLDDSLPWHEALLRQAVLAGDTSAWARWYHQESPCLERFVNWRCANLQDLTEEVLQETWLLAVKQLKKFDPEKGPFATWLRGLAQNTIRNSVRARKRRLSRVRIETALEQGSDPEQQRRSERVVEVLSELPEHYAEVLRQKYVEGLTVQEIAARGKESEKAIESLLTRARQAFRSAFAD
jgi:RNA polymerase sigma-70 factor, ECF subfamily